jgi:hypothetical protein
MKAFVVEKYGKSSIARSSFSSGHLGEGQTSSGAGGESTVFGGWPAAELNPAPRCRIVGTVLARFVRRMEPAHVD